MTSALTRRLQRLLDQQARALRPDRIFTRLHAFYFPISGEPATACPDTWWSAHLGGEIDITSGVRDAWCILAASGEEIDAAIEALTASGDVPASGEWERRQAGPPCADECRHVPRVVEAR